MVKRLTLALGAALLGMFVLGAVALADDGGLMQRTMGNDAYMAMVQRMRGVLGNERADQMLASCEAMMAAAQSVAGVQGGMSGVMSGGAMSQEMQGMMGQ